MMKGLSRVKRKAALLKDPSPMLQLVKDTGMQMLDGWQYIALILQLVVEGWSMVE